MKTQSKTRAEKHFENIPSDTMIEHDKSPMLISSAQLDPQTRHQMIEEAAYHLAAKRGFQGGSDMDDWLAAEAQIDAQPME